MLMHMHTVVDSMLTYILISTSGGYLSEEYAVKNWTTAMLHKDGKKDVNTAGVATMINY